MRFPIWLRAIKICARATWMRNFSNTSIKCDFVAPLAMNMSGGLIFQDTFENVNILNIGMPLCHPISHIWRFLGLSFTVFPLLWRGNVFSATLLICPQFASISAITASIQIKIFYEVGCPTDWHCFVKNRSCRLHILLFYYIYEHEFWPHLFPHQSKNKNQEGIHASPKNKLLAKTKRALYSCIVYCVVSNWISLESLNKISSYSQLLEYLFRWQ